MPGFADGVSGKSPADACPCEAVQVTRQPSAPPELEALPGPYLLEDEGLEDAGVCDLRVPKVHDLVQQLVNQHKICFDDLQ